jgi:hypothetical protein
VSAGQVAVIVANGNLPPSISIRIERGAVVALETRVLRRFLQDAIANHKQVELVAHEAPEGILGRTYNRFAANIKAGVDEHRASGLLLEAHQ